MFQTLDGCDTFVEFSVLCKNKLISVRNCYILFCKLGVPKVDIVFSLHFALWEKSYSTKIESRFSYNLNSLVFLDEPELIGGKPYDNTYVYIRHVLKHIDQENLTLVIHENYL